MSNIDPSAHDPTVTAAASQGREGSVGVATAPSGDAAPMARGGRPRGPFPFEMPRRSGEAGTTSTGRGARERSELPASRDKSMHVGAGVRFKGEISACDRLVIDGEAEATITDCRLVQIGVNGRLSGSIDTAELDVAGIVDGELIARDRVTVRGKGQLRGRVQYRHIVIEAGGVVSGALSPLDDDGASVASRGAAARKPVARPGSSD